MRTRQRVNTQTMNAPSVLASQRSPVASLLEFRDLVMGGRAMRRHRTAAHIRSECGGGIVGNRNRLELLIGGGVAMMWFANYSSPWPAILHFLASVLVF